MSRERFWITCDDAARRLEVTRQAISKRIKEGKLTTWRADHRVYLLEEDVEGWQLERIRAAFQALDAPGAARPPRQEEQSR